MSTEIFQVGDVVILQNTGMVSLEGQECTITAPLAYRTANNFNTTLGRIDGVIQSLCYIVDVRTPDGCTYAPKQPQVRRKPLPDFPDSKTDEVSDPNKLASWSDCVWKPNQVKEHS